MSARRAPKYPIEVPGGAADNGGSPAFTTPDVTTANHELVHTAKPRTK